MGPLQPIAPQHEPPLPLPAKMDCNHFFVLRVFAGAIDTVATVGYWDVSPKAVNSGAWRRGPGSGMALLVGGGGSMQAELLAELF